MESLTFDTIANWVHTGGQSALLVILYFFWQGSKRIAEALETLKAIKTQLEVAIVAEVARADKVTEKLGVIHDDISRLPLSLLRLNLK